MRLSIANQSKQIDLTSRFKSIYNGLLPLLQSIGKEETIKQINHLFSRIASNNVAVLVCGEFKRGKSSLVNALIGEDLCPVDDCITTSTVLLIRYGEKAKVIRHFLDSSNQIATEIINYSQIVNFSKGSSISIDNTILLEIEIPSEKLKSGLCVIDTPGIGGLDARHLSLTSFALTKADCVMFVADAGEPLSASELDFIKDKITPFGRNVKVVLNKIDTLSENQIPQLLKDIQQKVSRCTPTLDVDVIPTSMYQWQLYNIIGDESYKSASNMAGLEKGLSDIQKSFKESLYPILKSRILQAANEAKMLYQTQLQAISDPNPELISKLQEQGRLIAQSKKELEQPSSKFNRDLATMIDEAQNDAMAKFSSETIILSSSKLEDLLDSDSAHTSEGVKFVSEKLNESILSLSNQLDEMIDSCFEEILERVQVSFDEDKPEFDILLPSNLRLKEKSLSESVFNFVRNGMAGLGVFTFASVVGVSPVLGVLGGIAVAWKSIVGASEANRKAEIRQQIQPRLTIAINELRAYVQNRFKNFSNSLKEMMIGRVAEMEAEMMNTRIRLEECATDMQKIVAQKSEIQKRIAYIDTISNQLNLLLNNPFKVG